MDAFLRAVGHAFGIGDVQKRGQGGESGLGVGFAVLKAHQNAVLIKAFLRVNHKAAVQGAVHGQIRCNNQFSLQFLVLVFEKTSLFNLPAEGGGGAGGKAAHRREGFDIFKRFEHRRAADFVVFLAQKDGAVMCTVVHVIVDMGKVGLEEQSRCNPGSVIQPAHIGILEHEKHDQNVFL